jgi:hypothetical protein
MAEQPGIFLGMGETPRQLYLKFANRHGLIAGATGTGKTVSLQVMAEGFSREGVPVFMADVKGDLAGVSQPGPLDQRLVDRAVGMGLSDFDFEGFPTVFWDIFGEQGHPIRATISEMGPLLLSRLLELNETQEGVLNIAFKISDDHGLLLLDMKDLKALLAYVADQADKLTVEYGTVKKVSIGAIQRKLLTLEQQGAESFFGEPALDLSDLMRTGPRGYGYINVLAADKLMANPRLYATFMLWLLAELFEELPEVGDLEKPKLVFFFDEAHLLFQDAPKALMDKIEQVVRLIRSKGVGVYFISQNPLDVPDKVLGQLGNRVQHALRSFTPRDQKAVRAAAETFRPNPKFDAVSAITSLEVGEALVSTLEGKGAPSIVERAIIRPPCSRMGPVSTAERQAALRSSPIAGCYDQPVDRESAYEQLKGRTAGRQVQPVQTPADGQPAEEQGPSWWESVAGMGKSSGRQTILEAAAKSMARSMASSIGHQIVRGVLGSIFRGK